MHRATLLALVLSVIYLVVAGSACVRDSFERRDGIPSHVLRPEAETQAIVGYFYVVAAGLIALYWYAAKNPRGPLLAAGATCAAVGVLTLVAFDPEWAGALGIPIAALALWRGRCEPKRRAKATSPIETPPASAPAEGVRR